MSEIIERYKEDCKCRRKGCLTWAEITAYKCGCVTVEIFDDDDPCDECTDFSGKREYCEQSGHPDYHDD